VTHVERAIFRAYKGIARCRTVPKNEKEFKALVMFVDNLVELAGNDENSPYAELADKTSDLLLKYEANLWDNTVGDGLEDQP
jgi:hypothetical protein